jgi:hypothetical protein
MNSNPDEFETLRQLMALKRHEQPPQQYMNQLSGTIRSRIERGEGQLTFLERINFSWRPTLAYAMGLTVCGGLGMSAIYMVNQEMARSRDASETAVVAVPAAAAAYASQANLTQPQLHVANWLRNTNPASETQPEISYFNLSHNIRPVSYDTGN